MKSRVQKLLSIGAIVVFTLFALMVFSSGNKMSVRAQDTKPTPEPHKFDQKAAIAKIKESIKGREDELAGEVFKNVKDFAQLPAGRLLAVMEMGYARSLGVDCTHCHTPENWASDEKRAKKIAREMRTVARKINAELLPAVKEFEGRTGRDRPVVNCTTCHRGAVIPATNMGK